MTTEPITGTTAVWQMRDEFLQLVTAYNAIGNYRAAQDAQAIAIALNAFEDAHDITCIAWPPRIEMNEGGPSLVFAEAAS